MKTYFCRIEGTSPLLIQRFHETSEVTETMKRGHKKTYGTPREQAEKAAYADPDGKLWAPSSWIKGCIMAISSDYRLPGSRKSLKSVAGGAVIPGEEKLYFLNKTLTDIEIDSRPVVVQRARIMRHRARLESWELEFSLSIDDSIVEPKHVHQIISDAGNRAGLGDYRPQKGGPYGKFLIKKWEEINEGEKL